MLFQKIASMSFGLALFFCLNLFTALAQSEVPRVEIGMHFTALRLTEFDRNDPGVGGRITFNLNRYLALEGEFNFLPRQLNLISEGRKQGLFGVKAGWRSDRFGIYGKARPGFVSFSKAENPVVCTAILPTPLSCTVGGTSPFAMDVGAVLEFYPSRKTLVRFDAGDTLIRYERFALRGKERFISHNAQFSIGAGYRF